MEVNKEPKPTFPVLGVVVRVMPYHSYMDGVVRRATPEVVTVRTDDGRSYSFITGSINGAPNERDRYVGRRCRIDWVSSASYSLPFFTPVCVFCEQANCNGTCREGLLDYAG